MATRATEAPKATPPELGSLLVPDQLSQWGWVLGYTAVFTALSVIRYQLWIATGWDLGYYEQGMWALYHQGLGAIATMSGYPVLADSASFVLILLSPFFVWFGVGFLFLLQSFALGLGYWWIQKLGRHFGVDQRRRQLIGLAYLCYPVLVASNLFDFHPDVLAVPLLFAAVYYAETRAWLRFAAAIVGTLLIKDMVAIAVAGVGVVLLGRKQWFPGLLTAVAGLAWLVLATSWFIPWLVHHPMSQWQAYYGQWGSTPLEGLRYLATHPWDFLRWSLEVRSWEYLVWIVGPTVLFTVPRRPSWGILLWIIPALLILETNLLSRFPAQTSPFDQYSLFAVPFLFIALCAWQGAAGSFHKKALIPSVVFLLVLAYHLHVTTWRSFPNDVDTLAVAISKIPPTAPVMAQNFVIPHVARRTAVYDLNQWSSVLGKMPLYVVIDTGFSTRGKVGYGVIQAVSTILGHYSPIFHAGSVTLYHVN